MLVDQRLLSLRRDFQVVWKDVQELKADQAIFEAIASNHALPNDQLAAVRLWYGRNLLVSIRRIVDDRKDVFSLTRLLLKLKSLKTKDFNGKAFEAKEIDDDIERLTTKARQATELANDLVAHRTNKITASILVPSLIRSPTVTELNDVIREIDETTQKYAARFFDVR